MTAAWLSGLPLHLLEQLGGLTRRAAMVLLATAALTAGVVAEAIDPRSWRRPTLRAELRRSLRQALAGSLFTTLVTAGLVGVGLVHQAMSWLAFAGQEGLAGGLLVLVLVREVAPVLVGLILLGRSGTVIVVEFGATKASGHLDVLEAQGLDPFALLVLPRVVAMGVAGFTLGVLFLATALSSGFLTGRLLGVVQTPFADLLTNLLGAMGKSDFTLFAVKMVLVGALVAVVAAITGMSSTRAETPSHLLPRGFVRGLFAILGTSVVLSMATA
jgi:phospholipid/cholesterol/gamma-HCH transport system permease protein